MSAVLGDRLRLPCSVLPRPGPCQWTKNGFGLGTDPELAAYTRYSMDSCDLVLDPVLAEDEAEYQCQAGVRRSPPVRVRVHQQPGPPHILQAKYGDLVEAAPGEVVRLECETQGGKPGADIVWRHGDGSKVEAEVMDIVTRMEDERQFRTRSVLKMVPEAAEETVYCEASSAVFPAARQSPPVRIRVRGQMAASLEFSKEEVEVGDTVDVTCRVENENSILTYTWFINNVEMAEEKADTIRLENVAPHHHKLRIKCAVESSGGGRAEAERPLVVTSPLRLVERPGRVLASPGDTVTLRCRAAAQLRLDPGLGPPPAGGRQRAQPPGGGGHGGRGQLRRDRGAGHGHGAHGAGRDHHQAASHRDGGGGRGIRAPGGHGRAVVPGAAPLRSSIMCQKSG